ncbi:hypothetical protein [Sphingobium yanoikuyae]|uniref:hypothetical protein n=1 Tax=Sphingobium yanoikuyae TaxID=13690 RepID=UPI00345ECB35
MMVRHHSTWTDPRMAEAYDLVADVVRDHSTADDKLAEVSGVLAEIDKADELLAGILHDRRSK